MTGRVAHAPGFDFEGAQRSVCERGALAVLVGPRRATARLIPLDRLGSAPLRAADKTRSCSKANASD